MRSETSTRTTGRATTRYARTSLAGLLLVAVAGLLALVGLAGPASAASNYPPATSCHVSGTSNGSSTTVTGTGFGANSPVSLSLGSASGVVTTDGSGSFSTTMGAGSGHLVGTGGGCTSGMDVAALATSRGETGSTGAVLPASVHTSGSGSLPNTGAHVLGAAAIAGVLLVGGVLLLVQGRRRHS